MANRYWRGGSGTWNNSNTTNWSATSGGAGGAMPPGQNDSVFFTLATTYTVTIDTNFTIVDFTVSAGNVTFAQSAYISTPVISGNFSVTGNTLFPVPSSGNTGTIIFRNLGGSYGATPKTIGTNGATLAFNVTFDNLNYNNTGCILSSAFKTANTRTFTLSEGTLNLNGFDLSTGTFNSSGSSTRTLIMGSGNINVISGVFCGEVNRMTFSKTTGAFTGPVGGTNYQWSSNHYSGYTTYITDPAPNLTFTGAGSSTALVSFGQGGNGYSSGMWDIIDFGSTACRVAHNSLETLLCSSVILNSSVDLLTNLVSLSQYGTGTFTGNGCTLYGVGVNWSTSNLTFGDSLTVASFGHSKGTLNLNGFNLTTRTFSSSNSTNARTLNWNGGSLYLVGTGVSVSMTSGTGLTVLNGPGNIFANIDGYVSTFNWCASSGGSLSTAPNLTLTGTGTAATSINTITSNSWFNNLDCSQPIIASNTISGTVNIGGDVVLSSAATSNFTNASFTFYGSACTYNTNNNTTNSVTIGNSTYQNASLTLLSSVSNNSSSSCSLLYGTLNLNGYSLTTGLFSSSNANTRTLNFDTGNIILTSTIAATTVLSMANATGFICTGTGGFTTAMSTTKTFTFGTTGGSASNAPNLLLTSGASIPTITTGSWFNTLDFTGSTCTPAITSLNLNGLVLASGGTYTNLTPIMRGTGTIITNGKILPSLTIYSSGTTTLGSAITTTGDTTITAGTLNLAGFTLNTPTVTSSSVSSRAITGTGNINVTGDWTISNGTNFTGSGYNINMTNASAKTFMGAGGSYGALVQAGAGVLTISDSNTFADIVATIRPSTITFTAGTTQIVAYFNLSGMVSNLVTINSSTAGTKFNLSKPAGAVNASYLNIQDTNVTGGATWRAYNGTNIDSGNNTGWAFVYVPPSITGQFMAFF